MSRNNSVRSFTPLIFIVLFVMVLIFATPMILGAVDNGGEPSAEYADEYEGVSNIVGFGAEISPILPLCIVFIGIIIGLVAFIKLR